jgi:hypothetical protein
MDEVKWPSCVCAYDDEAKLTENTEEQQSRRGRGACSDVRKNVPGRTAVRGAEQAGGATSPSPCAAKRHPNHRATGPRVRSRHHTPPCSPCSPWFHHDVVVCPIAAASSRSGVALTRVNSPVIRPSCSIRIRSLIPSSSGNSLETSTTARPAAVSWLISS